MTKRLLTTMAFVAALGASYCHAQMRPKLIAEIPFAFRVADKLLPAGQYTLITDTASGVAVLVRGEDPKDRMFLITHSCQRPATSMEGKLEFHEYGTTYFLSRIWGPGTEQGRELARSQAERETANAGIFQVASISVHKR